MFPINFRKKTSQLFKIPESLTVFFSDYVGVKVIFDIIKNPTHIKKVSLKITKQNLICLQK